MTRARRALIRGIPTLAAVAGVALFSSLGVWQLERAAQKEALLSRLEEARRAPPEHVESVAGVNSLDREGPVFEQVTIRGQYLSGHQFLLDNQVQDGRVGFHVLTPLRIDGGHVIVDRGWVPVGRTRDDLPDVAVGEAPRAVTGVLTGFPRAGIEVAAARGEGWPRVVQYPAAADLARMLDAPVATLMLRLGPEQPDGFRREWEPDVLAPRRHYGYAFQWFALAAAVVILYAVLTLRRRSDPDAESDEQSDE